MWNSWKVEVLADLYRRTMQHLAGDAPATDSTERLEQRRAAVRSCLAREAGSRAGSRGRSTPCRTPMRSARRPSGSPPSCASCTALAAATCMPAGRYLPESHTVEFVVGTHEQITPGVFHKLTGALASQGLQILSAEINTLADGLVLDRFYVHDPDYAERAAAERLEEVDRAPGRSRCKSPQGATPAFRKVWRSAASRDRGALVTLPTRVRIDNSTSDRFTIIDVFASRPDGPAVHDRAHAVRDGPVGIGRQDRHVSGPGRRRVLRHRPGRATRSTTSSGCSKSARRLLEAIDGMAAID